MSDRTWTLSFFFRFRYKLTQYLLFRFWCYLLGFSVFLDLKNETRTETIKTEIVYDNFIFGCCSVFVITAIPKKPSFIHYKISLLPKKYRYFLNKKYRFSRKIPELYAFRYLIYCSRDQNIFYRNQKINFFTRRNLYKKFRNRIL